MPRFPRERPPAPQPPAPRPPSGPGSAAPGCTTGPGDVVDRLRRRIDALAGGAVADGTAPASRPAVPLGLAAIDRRLPWGGLPRAALHEIVAGEDAPTAETAAAGFATVLLGRFSAAAGNGGAPAGPVLWCRRAAHGFRPGLLGAGLARFGLDPARLILVQAASTRDILWTLEEALRSRALAAVLGEVDGNAQAVDDRALRRLQLAAEDGGTAALLLRPSGLGRAGPAVTRWRVTARPRRRWRLELTGGRGGGRPGAWLVEWRAGGWSGGRDADG